MVSSMISWFVFVIFTSQTTASHFRGGIITWKPDEYIGNKVNFNFRLGFRRSFSNSYFCDSAMVAQQSIVGSGGSWSARHDRGYYGSRTVADTGYHCTDFSVNEDWTQGENTFNYTFPDDGPWLVSYSGCCWISLANGGGNWFLSTTVNLTRRQDNGKINSSPISALSPIVRHQQGCSKTIVIPAEDSDDDKVRCRWSSGSQRECGGVCQGFSSSGTLDEEKCTLRLYRNAALGWHALSITLEDFPASTTNFQTATPFSHVSLQFLVHVASSSGPCNRAPLLIGQSPNDGSCEEVPKGGIFYSIIEAKHVDSSRRIAEIITVTPLYMNLTNLLNYTDNVGDNVYYKNVSWSPKSSQKGRHIFCFKAIDDYGMESDQRCITILVGTSNTPRPILSTRTPLIPTLYWPLGSGFVDFNITFDQQIKRPRHSKFIRIILQGHVIYKLDTRSSSDVTIDQNGFTLRFSLPQVVMSMRGNYSVIMDRGAVVGLGCTSDGPPTPGISSTKSWHFNVGVCSKGTFIADGYNCDDVDECSNPSSILSRKKRNIWYWPNSSATPLLPAIYSSPLSTEITPSPSSTQGSSTSITSTVSVNGSCPYFTNGQLNGRFTSPNYPSYYRNNERCSLLIEAPYGHHIYLQFRSFYLEYGSSRCPYDYVEIFDGNSAWSSKITRACGQRRNAPCEIYSSGRFLYVKFSSDGSGQYPGFSAYYYALSNSQNFQQVMSPIVISSCNTVTSSPLISSTRGITPTPSLMQGYSASITSTVSVSGSCPYFMNGQLNGRFTSPNYPSYYGNNERCSLLIEAPHGHHIFLQFTSFSLEYGRARCPYDYVEIFDGNSAWSSKITRACGQQHQAPCEIYSSGRFLYVKFYSDSSGRYSGFSAFYYAVSNSQVMSPIVKSSCNIITSSPLISSTRASSAAITSTASLSGIAPAPSLMQGYSASIASTVSVSGSCPYFMNSQLNGRFTSPNYPSYYRNNERCSLLIEAPQGHHIYLQFTSFSLEYGRAHCPYDYVEIFDGNSAWSSKITRACGQQHQAPCEIYSSGRFLYMKFSSDGSGQYPGFSAYYYALSNSQNVQQVMSPIVKSSCNIVTSSPLISSTRAGASSPRSAEITPIPSFTQGLSTSVTSTVSVSACYNHSYMEDAHRGIGFSGYYGYYRCDNNLLSGWYRFRGAAGTEMPTSCIATHRCGTHAPGWLSGSHPSVADGAVYATVCFHWSSRCCRWSTSIRVRNCSGFYVYELGPTPNCYLRYCGNGGANYSTTSKTNVTVISPSPASSAPITSSASVSGSCSYYLSHHYGNFKSPNYPSNYGDNEHCTWLIEVPRGYYIYLNFGSLDLERCYNCGCDVLKIFDGNSTASPMIKRACGQQTSGCGMYSSGRFLFVQFSSDGSNTRRGFSATYGLVSYNYGNSVNQGQSNSDAILWCTSSSTPFHPSIHSISVTKSSPYIPWTVSAAGSRNIRASIATVMPTASRVPFVLHLPANCQHNCVNTWGSYYCTCRQGYKLQADEKTCVDINECETQNGGCTHQCINTPGSHYCKCREGTTMNIDNKTCHEPGINVRCTDETMSIFLERKSFKGFDPNTLTLVYPSCRASYNDTHITLRTSLNDCGTTHNESEDAITFYNEVRSVQFSPGTVITRDQNVSIPFYCSFGRRAIVQNPSFKTWKNYVTSSEGGYGNFTFTMDMFRTSNYYTPYGYNDYPITVSLQDRLFLQIAVKSHQSNLVAFVDTCKATPSPDPYSVPQYIFIQRGCGLDSTLNYSYSINSEQRFSIQAFRFIKDHPVVHFHCEVLACHRNTARSRCLQGCSRSRGRRDEDPGSESTQVYEMSSGPIKFQKTNPGKMGKSTDVQTNTGLVTGVAAAGGLFLFLAIALAVAVVQVKKRFKGALADRNRVYAMEQFSKYVKEEEDNDGFTQDDDVNESGEQNFNKKASA